MAGNGSGAKIALATNKYGEAEATPLTKMFHERKIMKYI